jgi:hypothetical protein
MSKNNKIYNLKIIKAGEYERYKYYELACIVPDNGGKTGIRGQAKDREESIRRAMHRAREKIYGYVIANEWEYWATQTFNSEAIDRYNLDEIVSRYNKKLKNLKSRKYQELKWLIVPEHHKDGAIHLHMFMSGISKDSLKFTGRYHYSGGKKRPIYNWLDTVDYGFNYYLCIGDLEPLERVITTNYVTKYITKELVKKRFNKKMYWCSRGLREPSISSTYVYDYDVETIKSSGTIITQNTYCLKDPESGEIFNTVHDFTLHCPKMD